MIKVWWKNIQTSPIMFIKIYEKIVNNRFPPSFPSHRIFICSHFAFISIPSFRASFFFLPALFFLLPVC